MEDAVVDVEIIARKDYYNILYMEAESNWRGISTEVAKKSLNPCLVITRYGEIAHNPVHHKGSQHAKPEIQAHRDRDWHEGEEIHR